MTNAKDLFGICMRCKEWTSVLEPCCSEAVEIEGHLYYYDDYCEKCGEPLDGDRCETCAAALDAQRKGGGK